jgi:hypothetical protein
MEGLQMMLIAIGFFVVFGAVGAFLNGGDPGEPPDAKTGV